MTADEEYMAKALREAALGAEWGEVPVGAVVVGEGRILGKGYNRPIHDGDPTAHAEIVALRKACAQAGNYRLPGATLYVTIEPCAMCLGAIVLARIGRLVYGALDPKAGAIASIMTFPFERTNHRLEIEGGVLAAECGRLLKDFFRSRRGSK